MRVLLYVNPEKDTNEEYRSRLISLLNKHGIECDCIVDDTNVENNNYSALIVLGGDGTILHRTEFANRFRIPIIGINCGKLGFLSEFEINKAEDAIIMLKNGDYVIDERLTLKTVFNGKTYLALNDISLTRVYEDTDRVIVRLGIKIGEETLPDMVGDGIVASTPTGSTAYSLSAGGAILEPHIDAFCITPIAAHSLLSRAVVCSAKNVCTFTNKDGAKVGVFADGKLIGYLTECDSVSISVSETKTLFLRKRGFDFFARLNSKMLLR